MYKQAKPFFMIVQTPLHAGSGQDLGIVDQPIQRERHTSFPKIEGSSLKGAIREIFEESNILKQNGSNNGNSYEYKYELINIEKYKDLSSEINNKWKIVDQKINNETKKVQLNKFNEAISLSFGPENGDDHAGALGFTDARLLLFPVKSMKGVFAYITCPYVLERFKEDLKLNPEINDIATLPGEETLSDAGVLTVSGQCKIILEEYTFDVKFEETTKAFAEWLSKRLPSEISNDIKKKMVILKNDDFKDFVNLSTEVITRTKINPETGTVQSGALFTEEYLPTESVLYSLALTTPIFIKEENQKGIFIKEAIQSKDEDKWKEKEESRVMKFFELGLPDVMQIGGNATIGKGIVKTQTWRAK